MLAGVFSLAGNSVVLNMGLIHWLENHLFPCAYKQFFGIDCPVCGFQRSLIELLKGNFWESFLIYPALIPSLILIIIFVLHLILRKKTSRRILIWVARVDLLIITISYIWHLAT